MFFLHFFVQKVFTFSKVPLKGYPLGCPSSQDGNRHHLDDITCLGDRGSPKASFDTMTGEGGSGPSYLIWVLPKHWKNQWKLLSLKTGSRIITTNEIILSTVNQGWQPSSFIFSCSSFPPRTPPRNFELCAFAGVFRLQCLVRILENSIRVGGWVRSLEGVFQKRFSWNRVMKTKNIPKQPAATFCWKKIGEPQAGNCDQSLRIFRKILGWNLGWRKGPSWDSSVGILPKSWLSRLFYRTSGICY